MIQEADFRTAAQVDASLAQPNSQEIARREQELVSAVVELIDKLSLCLHASKLGGSLDLAELRALLQSCDTQMDDLNTLIGREAWSEKYSVVELSLVQIESWLAVLGAHFNNSEFSNRTNGLEMQLFAGLTSAKEKGAEPAVAALLSAIQKLMANQVLLAAAAIGRFQEQNVG